MMGGAEAVEAAETAAVVEAVNDEVVVGLHAHHDFPGQQHCFCLLMTCQSLPEADQVVRHQQ